MNTNIKIPKTEKTKKPTKAELKEQEREKFKKNLLNILDGQQEIYIEYFPVRSGITHHLKVFVPLKNKYEERQLQISNITYQVSKIVDRKMRDGKIVSHGGGMDMAFELFYVLCSYLFPEANHDQTRFKLQYRNL